MRESSMKKAHAKPEQDDLRPEYDLSRLKGGVRGKYLDRYRSGTNLALLASDVRAAFPTDESVNQALRSLMIAVPLSWQKAIVRVRQHGKDRPYMPTVLLAALSYFERQLGETEPTEILIPFEKVERPFKDWIEQLDPARNSDASRPFYWLSKGAKVWDLFEGPRRTPFTWRETRDAPPAQRLRDKVRARFKDDLVPELVNERLRELIKAELTRLLNQQATQPPAQVLVD
jgi:hypothetical protein